MSLSKGFFDGSPPWAKGGRETPDGVLLFGETNKDYPPDPRDIEGDMRLKEQAEDLESESDLFVDRILAQLSGEAEPTASPTELWGQLNRHHLSAEQRKRAVKIYENSHKGWGG